MSTPEIKETTPTKPFARKNNLFKNKYGEYAICVKGANGRHRWLPLGVTTREDAVRRLQATGVADVIEIIEDDRFREKVVEVLTTGKIVTLERVVEEWLKDATARLHTHSVGHHHAIGKQFLALFRPGTDITTVTAERCNSWINTAPSLTRRRRRMSILEDLFGFAFHQGYRKDHLGKRLALKLGDLTFDQMERKVKEVFTEEEFKQLLACEQITGFWRWAIQLSWWLGFRLSDCASMQWGSFCAAPGKLVVWQQKTRTRFELDLSDPVLGGGEITRIISEIRAQASDAVYCFPEVRGLHQSTNRAILVPQFRACCEAAGVDTRKTFSHLRKTAAMRWRAAGRSLQEIGRLLGHEGTGNVPYYLDTSTK